MRRLLRRLRDQRGLALPLTLGMLLTLSVSGTTVLYTSSTNEKASRTSKTDMMAFALAEAGINNAMSVLAKPGTNPLQSNLLPARTTTYETGTVTWSGTFNINTLTWALTSVATVTGPNSARDVVRVITANVFIEQLETQTRQNDAWNFVFVTNFSGSTTACDFSVTPNSTWDAPIYVFGNLCLTNGSKIIGAGPIITKQRILLNGSTSPPYVGTSSTPIGTVEVGVGCKYLSQHLHPDATHPAHPFCSPTDQVHASTLSNTPRVINPPVPEYDTWFQNSAPGPKWGCTYSTSTNGGALPVFDNEGTSGTRNNSITSAFNLTPSTYSYECRVGPDFSPVAPPTAGPYKTEPYGLLKWDKDLRTLTIWGTVFIDGSATVQAASGSAPLQYNGYGTIYVQGTFNVTGTSTYLCASIAASGTDCNWNWDRNAESLTIVAYDQQGGTSVQLANNTRVQANLYGRNQITVGSSAKHEGALVTASLSLGASSVIDPFSTIDKVPTGTPGTAPVFGTPRAPEYS